ncbi:MAG TPA: family 78 glycoside hydrolase catalytic domain [Pseudacidobacterium sp.]|jgi:alpha-L-rhamnosidase|nr:family 78 glycoside hydrolase catalytic domain [Pseudacidobacterium sp.]
MGRKCRPYSRLVVILFIFNLSALFHGFAASQEAEQATHLRCDALEDALGIDTAHPRLSWQLQASRRGAAQSAYRIEVASREELLLRNAPDVWDSGRVQGADSVNIPYAGKPLVSRHRYYWRVVLWDEKSKQLAPSQSNWWEMGLLAPSDWTAKWISGEDEIVRQDRAAAPKWIWTSGEEALTAPKSGAHAFRFSFDLSEAPKQATLLITGKNTVTAWINGKQVVNTAVKSPWGSSREWGTFKEADVTSELQNGTNFIAAQVPVADHEGSAGLIALLRVTLQDGKTLRFVSDSSWKSVLPEDSKWMGAGYADQNWPNASVVAEIGQEPLGTPWPPEPATLMRHNFSLRKPIREARLYATALGAYEIFLNGKRVGDQILAPGWTDYRKSIAYQAYDVTALLRNGENAIGALLGDGWYGSGLTWLQTRFNFGPPPLRLLAQLEVEYQDGTRDVISTDNHWVASSSPVIRSDVYNGELFDARLIQHGWDMPDFDANNWRAVTVGPDWTVAPSAQNYQPVRIATLLNAKSVTEPSPGVFIFDLGQNMVGWARLQVRGPRGTKVRLRFGEVLQPNGQLYTENMRSAEATDTYILSGNGPEIFEPHFTFHGFRYVEVTGYPGRPLQDAVQGVVFHTNSPFTVKLQSGDAMVNRLWQNILWGQRGNFVSVPTDCPQRDERLGWMGDAEVFWRTASYNMALDAFSHKFARDMREAQAADGRYGDVSPRFGPDLGAGVAGWADAGIIIPWTVWVQYHDRDMIQENWEAMEHWMSHLESKNPDFLWRNDRNADYGDWLAIGSNTPKDLIATAFWAYDATLMSQMTAAIGKQDKAEYYHQLFEKIRTAFQDAFVKADGSVGSNSQTSYVLALNMKLLPEEKRQQAADRIVEDIAAHHGHLTTGFLGTPFLLEVLSRSGHADTAYKLLLNHSFPSWGYMVDHGATTMWERWNGDQMLGDPSMNSFNHYAYGAVGAWLYRFAAGIDTSTEDNGFHHILLHPHFNESLGSLSVSYESPYGTISSSWTDEHGKVQWNFTIPPNTIATIELPVATHILEEGKPIEQNSFLKIKKAGNGVGTIEAVSGSYQTEFELAK